MRLRGRGGVRCAGADTPLRTFGDALAAGRIARRDLRAAPRPYDPGRVVVIAVPLPARPAPEARAWPLAVPRPVSALRGLPCRTYDGAAARRAARLLSPAMRVHRWRAGGHLRRLVVYPLLPGERTCADLAPPAVAATAWARPAGSG